MLMSHTASLPDSLPGGIDWISNITTSQIFEAISKLPVTVPLGTLSSYSNLGISLLGHILAEFIADVSEQGDLDALLNKYILLPLNLTPNTGVKSAETVSYRHEITRFKYNKLMQKMMTI
jgi:CubicO group peptidase (beta-lactamase class C family)